MHGFTGRYCVLCGSQQATTTYDEDTGYPIEQCSGCGAFLRTDNPPSSPPDAHRTLDVDTARLYGAELVAEDLQEAAEREDEQRRLGLWS